jgi:hypothetical protein
MLFTWKQQVLRRMAIETGALEDAATAGVSPATTTAAATAVAKSSSDEDKTDTAVQRATPLSASQVELAVAMVQVLSDGE